MSNFPVQNAKLRSLQSLPDRVSRSRKNGPYSSDSIPCWESRINIRKV